MHATKVEMHSIRSRCVVCVDAELKLWLVAEDQNQRVVEEQRYEIMRCPSCGLGYTIHGLRVEELWRYYPKQYYSLDDNRRMEGSKASRVYRKTRMARIKRYASSGLLLDIGAGTGMFMKWAKESGFEVEGLELSRDAAEYGSKEWGLAIRQGDLHETVFPPSRYDVVTLSHVFEHLHEPLTAARKLYEITKPGGLLVVAVPNFESLQARVFGKRWYHLDVPRHLFHYTPRSLRAFIERAGFKIIGLSFFSPEHNWAGILGSVMRLNAPGERFMHKVVRKLAGVPAARAAAYVEAVLSRGGTFEIYARK